MAAGLPMGYTVVLKQQCNDSEQNETPVSQIQPGESKTSKLDTQCGHLPSLVLVGGVTSSVPTCHSVDRSTFTGASPPSLQETASILRCACEEPKEM